MGFVSQIQNVLNGDSMHEIMDRISSARNLFKKEFIAKDIVSSPVQFIYKYLNSDVIDNAIKVNPRIEKILSEYNLDLNYNIDNVVSIIASHLIPTARCAERLYLNCNKETSPEMLEKLIQAALLHDIGKVFIPSAILNKTSRLNAKERAIIELHNKLSYEILITTDLDINVARLAYEHHNYENDVERNMYNQMLTIADVYCALREKRPYKKAINDIAARTILYDMGTKGSFDVGYVKYLW